MPNSFSFNGIDMSAYGLIVEAHDEPFSQETESVQLLDRAYPQNSVRPAMPITLDVTIVAADLTTLNSYLDSIRAAINQPMDKILKLDAYPDRYWLARSGAMEKDKKKPTKWEGTITFTAFDPDAYANTPTSSGPYTIDADPHEVIEVVGGTAKTFPVYTLTCDDTLTATTVGIENEATGEIIQWTGDLVTTDVLEIDTVTGIIKLNGVESMLTMGPGMQFPSLLPGSNTLNITGFSGTLTIVYPARYV